MKRAVPVIPKRSGNELIFQMQAINNIEILNGYKVKKLSQPAFIA